ncbi:hypothetical protein [Paludisphaera sp.]|uniref:PGN_0703 family putative restriction endonuclease n=1 Tax=Paludisphaera sp. TaxID=2017432 RepID=UPI00301CA145
MSPYEYIKHRQILWALRHGKRLGSQFRHDADPARVERGEKLFTFDLDDNLFEPLAPEVRREFEAGDGGELEGKMNAVHSSSATAVNFFHYWRRRGLIAEAARAVRVPSTGIAGLRFEARFPIHADFFKAPNLDVVIDYVPGNVLKATAIECKFNEPFGGWGRKGLKPVYLDHKEFWTELPNLRAIAEQVSPADTRFVALDVPQLLKHTLGLMNAYGKRGFRLLYLHYDAPGPAAVRHAEEIAEFSRHMERDGVMFQSSTYQEAILSLARDRRAEHEAFVDYLAERYL